MDLVPVKRALKFARSIAEAPMQAHDASEAGNDFAVIKHVLGMLPHGQYALAVFFLLTGLLSEGESKNTLEDDIREIKESLQRDKSSARQIAQILHIDPQLLLDLPDASWQTMLAAGIKSELSTAWFDLTVADSEGVKQIQDMLTRFAWDQSMSGAIEAQRLEDLKESFSSVSQQIEELKRSIGLVSRDNDPLVMLFLPTPPAGDPYHFARGHTPYGREGEKDWLLSFLNQDVPFSWAVVHGVGGQGKSQLAYWLVARATGSRPPGCDQEWQAGFVDEIWPEKFSQWLPQRPLLMVVDSPFSEHSASWRAVMRRLLRHENKFSYPVRVLFVERSDQGSWFDEVLGKDVLSFNEHRFGYNEGNWTYALESPLILEPLEGRPTWDLFRWAHEQAGGEWLPDEMRREILRELVRLKSPNDLDENPPGLFVCYAARAMAQGLNPRDWTRERILSDRLETILSTWSEQDVTEPYIDWLFLATLMGGAAFEQLPQDGVFPKQPDAKQFRRVVHYCEPQIASLSMPKLPPDPLGEFFVLERLAGRARLKHDDVREESVKRAAGLIEFAYRQSSLWLEDWLYRAVIDCPSVEGWSNFPRLPVRKIAIHNRPLTTDGFRQLCRFSEVEDLEVFGGTVDDLSAVCDLRDLTKLALSQLKVRDIGPLAGLTKLTSLIVDQCPIESIAALSILVLLDNLRIGGTDIDDLSPVQDLINLRDLDISQTRVTDLGPVAKLRNLKLLMLSNTKVEDLTPLSDLAQLESLYLSGTPVRDLSPLSSLSSLKELFLRNTSVRDIGPLHNLHQLQILDLSRSLVSRKQIEAFKAKVPKCQVKDEYLGL